MGEALAVAREHVARMRGRRLLAHEVCASVGVRTRPWATWREAELAVALAWLDLQQRNPQ